jgi:hypothetical protein
MEQAGNGENKKLGVQEWVVDNQGVGELSRTTTVEWENHLTV